jgi:protein TonB
MASLRIPFALASGLMLALAGFFGLVQLIGAPLDVEKAVVVDRYVFTPQRRTTPPENKRDPKIIREKPEAVPAGPRLIVDDFGDDAIATVRPPTTKIGLPGRNGGFQMGIDRDAIPLVRVNPTYPPREQARGIEGWVIVQFNVTAAGTVRDATVVDSEPKSVFDAAALEAIGRWRYNPRVDRGIAVERVGLQTMIRFTLENGV